MDMKQYKGMLLAAALMLPLLSASASNALSIYNLHTNPDPIIAGGEESV